VIPAGVAAVHPAILGRVLALGQRLTRGRVSLDPPPWPAMLGLIVRAVPTWLLVGMASVAVTESLGYDQRPSQVAFAAVAAWILGFLAVPVPAGAGVRELVFVAFSGLAGGPATAVATIARVLLIIVDAIGGLLGLWFARRAAANRLSTANVPD
jgi:glycosyltransferase 2 family protein